jgi:hypothetical protein
VVYVYRKVPEWYQTATSITLLRGIHENVIEFSPATVAEADPP